MARGDQERDKLREKLLQQGRTRQQIAAAMAHKFGDRQRAAWRHAHGWTQDQAAACFNEMIGDQQAAMTGNRISDYERWPIGGSGSKPAPETLDILADIYGTTRLKLVDDHDRQKMTPRELASLAALEKQTSASGNTTHNRRSSTYAENVEIPEQLPNVASYFVGRNHELEKLTAQLDNTTADGSPVVITAIGGAPGIGKTALAVHWAQTHSDHFPDGQLYVNLRGFHPSGTPMPPQEAIRGFIDAFHTPVEKIPTSLDAQAALYRNLVKDRRLVIVLDNARDADQVRPLLPDSPTCMVLVTSRQQLNSLAYDGATHITLGFLTTAEARQLLIKILGPERIHAEPEAVDELIHRCVHLPTALHIAAARIKAEFHTSLGVLVCQLREQRQRLAALSTGDSQYFDICAVFSWSYTALSTGAARLFRLLGLHPGPDISTPAAASLAGLPEHDTCTLLTELTRTHLLEEPTSGRYQFHDLLRAYASEQATTQEPESQQRAALHRVLDYYLHTGFTANRHLSPHRNLITLQAPQLGVTPSPITDYEQALNWFTTEHTVLLTTVDYAATHGFDTHAWQLPWTLDTFLPRLGHWHDQAAIQQTALDAARRLGDRAAQAVTHHALGHASFLLGHNAEASTHLQRALTLYLDIDDRTGQAHTHLSLSLVCERQSQHGQAIIHDQHALDLYSITGNHAGKANALNSLGWDHARLRHYEQALLYCQKALNLHRELGNRYGEACARDSLGYAYHHLGHHDQAITNYQHALRLRRDLDDYYGETSTLIHLGDTHHATGNLAAARDTWQQALTIFDRLGHSDAEHVRTKLASLDADTDDLCT